jgi:protein SCO1/2
MRTTLHVLLILLVGIGLGLVARNLRNKMTARPDADAVVHTTNVAPGDVVPDTAQPIVDPTPPPEGWLSRFDLTERSGESLTSDQLLGTPYVVSFFFSTCPGSCVQQNQKLKELQTEFGGVGIRFLAISVDPERDSPEVLREYAARFGADPQQWLFLTGDLTYIRRVGAEVFRLPVDRQLHTDKFVLVDKEGKIRDYFYWPDPAQMDKLKSQIRKLLQES